MAYLNKFKDKHKNERCFIVGNGPSLENTPLDLLNTEVTFATNKIGKIFNSTNWRPTYYCFTRTKINDNREKNINNILTENVTIFMADDYKDRFSGHENIFFLERERVSDHSYEAYNDPDLPNHAKKYWSDDITNKVFLYNTSLFPLFQISNFMGFKKIYLVGCDLGIDSTDHLLFDDAECPYLFSKWAEDRGMSELQKHMSFVLNSDPIFKSVLNGIYLKLSGRSSFGQDPHFGDNYQDKRIRLGVDDKQRRAHKLARLKLNERGTSIFNATRGGELEIHPRVDINDIL